MYPIQAIPSSSDVVALPTISPDQSVHHRAPSHNHHAVPYIFAVLSTAVHMSPYNDIELYDIGICMLILVAHHANCALMPY